MNVVGRVGSFISQGVYSVATPFHPFGGAVDIIVVQQQDGSFRSTPWYVRFGKFQGVLKGAEKFVRINVNGTEANFHMYLDNSGEAYFVREVISGKDSENGVDNGTRVTVENGSIDTENYSSSNSEREGTIGITRYDSCFSDPGVVQTHNGAHFDRSESDADRRFYEFSDEPSPQDDSDQESVANGGETVHDGDKLCESPGPKSEVVLFSVDGHVLTAPILASDGDAENFQSSTPQFHLGPGEEADFVEDSDGTWATNYINEIKSSSKNISQDNSYKSEEVSNVHCVEVVEEDATNDVQVQTSEVVSPVQDSEASPEGITRKDIFKSCLELAELGAHCERSHSRDLGSTLEAPKEVDDIDGESSRDISKSQPDDGDAFSPCSSNSPVSIVSSEVPVDVETVVSQEKVASEMVSEDTSVPFSSNEVQSEDTSVPFSGNEVQSEDTSVPFIGNEVHSEDTSAPFSGNEVQLEDTSEPLTGNEVKSEDEKSVTTAPLDELVSGDQETPETHDESQTALSIHSSDAIAMQSKASKSNFLSMLSCSSIFTFFVLSL